MARLAEFLLAVSQDVDERLDDLLPSADVAPTLLHNAIRWSIFAGGKRFRPALLIAVGQAFGARRSALVTAAAGIEMIHTYSLIHDDLPAMDDDELRRGKATCHVKFGEATAILAGDVLQTLAFKAIADDREISAEVRLRLISEFAIAAGTPNGMVSGQQLDLEAEGKNLTIEAIAETHRQKTGALISAAAACGAIIAEANDSEITSIRAYAERLGLLFQITDDLLDVTQETQILGKTAGKDVSSQKATFPAHLGIDRTREMAASIREEALNALSQIDRNTGLLEDLIEYVANRTS